MVLFPNGLDDFSNPVEGSKMNDALVVHHVQHANNNDAIEALERKVGVDSSNVTTSLDYRIRQVENDFDTVSISSIPYGSLTAWDEFLTVGAINNGSASQSGQAWHTTGNAVSVTSAHNLESASSGNGYFWIEDIGPAGQMAFEFSFKSGSTNNAAVIATFSGVESPSDPSLTGIRFKFTPTNWSAYVWNNPSFPAAFASGSYTAIGVNQKVRVVIRRVSVQFIGITLPDGSMVNISEPTLNDFNTYWDTTVLVGFEEPGGTFATDRRPVIHSFATSGVWNEATGPAGAGVPNGGTTGQLLVKLSNANQDSGWLSPSATSVANDTLWTAAGQTVYATGVGAGTRLNIGTANQIYTVNAGATAPQWVSTLGKTAILNFDEEVQDLAGGMVTGNTESGITVTYDDPGAKLNFTVTDAPLLQGSNGVFYLARANHTGTQSADTLTDGTTKKAFLATERTKLTGIATGATANSTDAILKARANHTGTQSADTITDGTTNKAFLATERTKLAGIATGATANSSDATLLARANHTGTQLSSTISDFATTVVTTVNAITSTAALSFVIDEDSFASDSATKVPTQQSVKAYVAANGGGAGVTDGDKGDIVVSGGGAVWTIDSGFTTNTDFFVAAPTGVAATDRANIQAQIDAAFAASPSGGNVLLRVGNYAISSALTMKSNIRIIGKGKSTTTITQATSGAHGFSGVDLSNIGFYNLKLIGPGQGVGSGDGINITISSNAATFYVEMDNVATDFWGRDGISIQTPIVSRFNQVIPFHSGRHGINLWSSGGVDGTSCSMISCFPAGNWGAGTRLKQIAYSTLNACAGDANGIAYEIDTCIGITANGCGTESPYNFNAHNTGYVGYAWKIYNSKIILNSPFMIQNVGTAVFIDNVSVVTINNLYESSPGNGDDPLSNPQYSIDVTAGCSVTINRATYSTPVRFAVGTTTQTGLVGPSSKDGVIYGSDTNLYRDATDSLKTDDAFTALSLKPTGMTGAVSASRYVGATTSAAPTTGTFVVGDFVVTHVGNMYVCTSAGSPGTWVKSGQNIFISVKDVAYGALGDGSTDDTTAINAAIAAASTAKAILYFPPGTYIVTPVSFSYSLLAKSDVYMLGTPGSIIKVKNSAIAYDSIISHNPINDVINFHIDGITFDQNAANNVQPDTGSHASPATPTTPHHHCFLRIFKGRKLSVRNCILTNLNSVNTLFFNGYQVSGDTQVSDVWIEDNVFDEIQGDGHDHSTIYTDCHQAIVEGNHFYVKETASHPSPSGVCAIETHGSGQRIINNTIVGFREAINSTGIAYRSDGQIVSGNTISKCLRGIRIYFGPLSGGANPRGVSFNITNNSMMLDPDYWATVETTYSQGIALSNLQSNTFQDIIINNNTISFAIYSGSSTNIANVNSYGIGFFRSGTLDTACKNITISNNTIDNAISAGIFSYERIEGLAIIGNTITNPGYHASLIGDDYHAGIYAEGGLKYTQISSNVITSSSSNTMRGINWVCSDTNTSNNSITDNMIKLTNASSLEVSVFGANTGTPYVDHVVRSGLAIVPSAACAFGSTINLPTLGLIKNQKAAPSGTTWVNYGLAQSVIGQFSDSSSPLTAGAGSQPVPIPAGAVVTGVMAAVGTAPTGAAILVDVNKNGTTMFTTQGNRPSIAISGTVSSLAIPGVTTVAAQDKITVDIDQIGSGTAGSKLTVTILGYFT